MAGELLGEIVLAPCGSTSSSVIIVTGPHSGREMQIGWDVDPSVRLGVTCYLYLVGRSRFYVSPDRISAASAVSAAESLFQKTLDKSSRKSQ